MVERKSAARTAGAEELARQNPLDYWYLQEMSPLDSGDPSYAPPVAADEDEMVSGWWILPVLVLSAPAWLVLWMVIF